jgi:hypothetical protein
LLHDVVKSDINNAAKFLMQQANQIEERQRE